MSVLAAMAQALRDPEQPSPAGLKAWNASDPAARFAVYRNNVMASLIEAIAESFPVCCDLLGGAAFRALARAYVLECPPASPVLVDYGDDFPDFLARQSVTMDCPPVADLARLERLYIESFHAADAMPLSHEALARHLGDPERLAQARLVLHPSLRLLISPHPVVSMWGAWQADQPAAPPETDGPRPAEAALLLRPGLVVEVTPLPPATAHFIAGLHGSLALGAAANRSAAEAPGFQAAPALAQLIRSGAIIDVVFQGET